MLGTGSSGVVTFLSSPQAASRSRAATAVALVAIMDQPRIGSRRARASCAAAAAFAVLMGNASAMATRARAADFAGFTAATVRAARSLLEQPFGDRTPLFALLVEAEFLEAPVERLGRELKQ